MIAKLKYYRAAIRWLWKHRAEPNNRAKWRRMMRDAKIACGYVAGYRGECCECHAITAAFDHENDAIAAWNRRANDE